VDATILEVGIGGTYDATNVIPRPVVCGIVSVGMDHEAVLGKTLASIAEHKGGIMKVLFSFFSFFSSFHHPNKIKKERKKKKGGRERIIINTLTSRKEFQHLLSPNYPKR